MALAALFVFIATIISGGFYFDRRVAPVIREIAVAKAAVIGVRAINEAVREAVGAANLRYDDLVVLERDHAGHITALTTDMVGINRFRTDIVREVAAKMESIPISDSAIPLGNVLGGEIFAGRGPKIPFRVVLAGFVETEFINDFTSAGINQTRHRIMLIVTCTVTALLPLGPASVQVTEQAIIAETVLIGVVPETYLNLSGLFG
jgi:sporulation protein YunB